MKLTEKISYLQGLLDGLEIDDSTKEGKALLKMSEVMTEITAYIDDLQSQVDELTELCDILDQDLGQVEEDLYGSDNEEDYDSLEDCDECLEDDAEDESEILEDDELYEITCPTCGDTIIIDEGMIDEGSVNCPNCNELLEFDFDDLTIEDFEENEESVDDAEEKKENKENKENKDKGKK